MRYAPLGSKKTPGPVIKVKNYTIAIPLNLFRVSQGQSAHP